MEFRKPTAADLPPVRRLLVEDPRESSDYAFSYHFPFADIPRTETRLAFTAGCAIWRWNDTDGYRHFFPFGGGDKRRALGELRDHCRAEGVPLKVSSMSAADCALFREALGTACDFRPDPNEADYVYRTDDLANLPGRRYQSRRTFVNAFTRAGDWSYAPISVRDTADCRAVLDGWRAAKVADGKPFPATLEEEAIATEVLLDRFAELDLTGGILRRNGRPVAFALGERLTDGMMLLAYEKALPSVHGAFQTGDREFARLCGAGFAEINRSWDEGMEGLRQMKRLYHPTRMIEKFTARAR